MKLIEAVACLVSASLLGGCAAMQEATRRNEARQLAWTGPGAGPCAFGGVTPAADEHCAMLAWGPEGVLTAINQKVRARLGPEASAQAHVEEASRILQQHDDLRSETLYTCAPRRAPGQDCQISLLVTAADGERFVLDSGAVLGAHVAPEGVATFMVFEMFVPGVHAIGAPPAQAVAGAGASTSPGSR